MNYHDLNRRDFLSATLAAASPALTGLLRAEPAPPAGSSNGKTSAVVQWRSEQVVRGRVVHKSLLADMIEFSLRGVTGADSSRDAWRSLLRPDDVIGLKFNKSAAASLGVGDPFARALIESLLGAGFEARQIVPMETSSDIYKEFGVVSPTPGWSDAKVHFGSGEDETAQVLDQVTAIVNVPFLKNHNIAGITCCLKNLSHALVRHPARFHGTHCAPYVGDIVALPKIHEKLRLHLVNALRVVYDRGPEAHDECTWDAGIILAGTDPVAIDSVGLDIINSQRLIFGLPEIARSGASIEHIRSAARQGLGIFDRRSIDLFKSVV